uniref:Uncharacterized protein n=1 Tax=Salix viminalis TaxID=40686 RepID=A0A6N2K7C9_SALVM
MTPGSDSKRSVKQQVRDEGGTMKTIVDTCFGFGWRSGVITKPLAGRRWDVSFKHGNEDRELCPSKIRLIDL